MTEIKSKKTFLQFALLNKFWMMLFLTNVACMVILVILYGRLNEERTAAIARGDIFALGYKLGKYSDLLTMEAQAFAVTGNIEHLINYWKEIEIEQNREKVIQRLTEYKFADHESHFLIQSKRNSDDLVQTEIRSMRLVLSAYQIPEELFPEPVKNFHLEPSDQALPPEKKLLLAQTILFDRMYAVNKAKIMDPIATFNENIARNIQASILERRETTNWVLFVLIMLFTLNSLLVVGTIWIKKNVMTD